MMLKRLLRRDNKGIGAVEFALLAPVLISFVIGISQMGKLFFASADMKNAIAHGARVASVWPVPKNPEIEAAVNDRLARSGAVAKADVEVTRGTDAGNEYADIKMTLQVPLEFIFFSIGPVTLEDTRRVYIQMDGVLPPPDSGGSTSTGTTTGGTTSTTSSGDASTSTTSAGGTTSSTSATSASSTGGTTSATSASSTSASTTSSTTSSSGNGNSNGNSNHDHGTCKNKKC